MYGDSEEPGQNHDPGQREHRPGVTSRGTSRIAAGRSEDPLEDPVLLTFVDE
jgi:hypothetical protein